MTGNPDGEIGSLQEPIRESVHGSVLSWIVSRQVFWVSIAAVLAFVVLSLSSDAFLTQGNLYNLARNFAFVAIIGLGMTAVIITGGIDISVGAVLAMSGMAFWVAVPLALGASLLVGAFNGAMVAYVGMPP